MFAEGLDEFDDSRHVVQDLIDEYEACETPDYMNYVSFFNTRKKKELINTFDNLLLLLLLYRVSRIRIRWKSKKENKKQRPFFHACKYIFPLSFLLSLIN